MIVAVPSYRRATNGQAQTFLHWPKVMPLHVFVRESEFTAYAYHLSEVRPDAPDRLISIPDDEVSNISSTRNWILNWCWQESHSKVLMVDDDLHFICRNIPGDDVHLRDCTLEDYGNLEGWFEMALGTYAHAAVSMREGNNRVEGKGAQVEATRGIRMVGYNVSQLHELGVQFREYLDGREDLDMTLQLLSRGLPNLVTYHFAQGQRVANAPGGLSEYRDVTHSDNSAAKLAAAWPDFVKLRDKVNKSGGEFGVRMETTIFWRRCLASASA